MSKQFKETKNEQPSMVEEIKKAFLSNKDITVNDLIAILNGKGLSFQPAELTNAFNKIKALEPTAENEPAKISEKEAKDAEKGKAPADYKDKSPSNPNKDASATDRIVAESILNGPVNLTAPSIGRSQ
jgi:hypothetical protein